MVDVVCPRCGSSNPVGFRFCGSCGEALERTCRACGTPSPLGFRFCGACGSALEVEEAPSVGTKAAAPVLVVEERKVVTSLFADLAASTELAARLDPEDLRRVLGPYFDAMAEEIERFGGTVEKFIGDAVVAFFGVPLAHEDDPERAVRAALAMQGRLDELNRDLAHRAGETLAMRIGVNTGEVFAHGGGIDEGLVTGEAVNVASRLQTLAEPGRVVVGERTWRDTRHAFGFRPLGEVQVKGIPRPLRAYEVGDELAPAERTAEAGPPFVGRGHELELLRLLFDRAVRERRPNLATIVGPPGIGKSRLAHELAHALAEGHGGARVVRGRCLPYGDGLMYWPLAEILKADAQILDNDPPGTALAKARERVGPRLGDGQTEVLLSSIGVMVPSDPLAGAEPSAAGRIIVGAWQRYLESLAAEGPLVALIEDVHWADPSLLDLIETVLGRAQGPALVVCTARPELVERRPAWSGGLTNATTITLSPLSPGESTELIEHLLDGGAPAEVVGPVLRRSEGNPFFAGELLRMMTEDGTLERRDGLWTLVRPLPSTLPDTVQSVIASRIDLLDPAEKRAIQDASVVGRQFWDGALRALGSSPGVLDGLLSKGLVFERPASSIRGERELIFHHILTRDVAYASLPRARLADAHARVASWIEDATRGRVDEFGEVVAHHSERAGDDARTARYGLVAGNRHLRVFAAPVAIEWFDRAAAAAERAGEHAVRARVALARGRAYEQLGRIEEARADYDAALVLARAAGDTEDEAAALAALAHALWLLDRFDEAQALLPVALQAAREVGARELEARLLYTAGTTQFGRGAFADALPYHEEALRIATESGDLEGQALAHHGLCETYFFVGPFATGLEHGREADRLLRELGQKPMVAHNGYMVAWLLGFIGRHDEGMAAAEESIAISTEIGNRRDLAFALYERAELALSAGRLGDAIRDAAEGMAILRELGAPRGEIIGRNVTHDVVVEAWAFDRLRDTVPTTVAQCEALGGNFQRSLVMAFAAFAATTGGDRESAARLFARAEELSEALLDVAWTARTEVLAHEWAGDAEGLDRVAARVEDRLPRTASIWRPWGTHARALAALLRGAWRDAAELGEAVVAEASAVGERRAEWRGHRVAARAFDGLGRSGDAGRHREAGRAIVVGIAEATPEALRTSFLARPDVAELLEAP
ncbi:MAG TPA: AAA family ATPase [Actinomycetota bacterium]|nr:AAA family ATPase [Actinomycetota bacterium]